MKTPEQKAGKILAFFNPKFHKRDPDTKERITEPRCRTTWGTKTKLGVIKSLVRILDDAEGPDSANKDA